MKCSNCRQHVDVIKQRLFKYEGVRVENIYLLNVEVKVCAACGMESPILRNVTKLHSAIGRAIALQPGRLSGDEMRFLRRSSAAQVQDWAERLGVAEGTYSKWENSHRPVGEQSDRPGRLLFILDALAETHGEYTQTELAKRVMDLKLDSPRDYVLAVDVDDLAAEPQYISLESPLLADSMYSVIEVQPIFPELDLFARLIVVDGGLVGAPAPLEETNCKDYFYASDNLALAA